jgi:hypothetical protein
VTTESTPTQQTQENEDGPNDPDRALVILADSGEAYKLDQDDWMIDEFAYALTTGDQGIIKQLDSFGSLLAFVEKQDSSTTFVNQRAILKVADDVKPLPNKPQGAERGPVPADDESLTVLGDDGRVYVLQSQDWKTDEFKLSPENGSDRIADKLAELGSYVAFVRKDIALQIGACCIVINLRAILAGQNAQLPRITSSAAPSSFSP